MDEFELIRRYFMRSRGDAGVILRIGDDGAVLRAESGRDLVVVVDTLVEGVHFPADLPAGDVGYRAVAVNLSDIAAMGAEPHWMTLALTLATADQGWLAAFADGLYSAADEHQVSLVGGDTTRGDHVVVSVQVIGTASEGLAITRSGAGPGDTVYVTGTVGDAAAGLELLKTGRSDDFLVGRFRRPSPRVAYGRALAGIASAAIDVSDGLFADLGKLLAASGAGAEIDLDRLPMSNALLSCFDADQCRRLALSGGDDYELCFTSHRELPDPGELRVTPFGTVVERPGIVCRSKGEVVPVSDSGYRHFK